MQIEGRRETVPTGKRISAAVLLAILFTIALSMPAVSASSAVVAVDPTTKTVPVGSSFSVNLNVTNIYNFTSWQFQMFFLRSVLNCTGVTEGPFLKTGGSTFFGKNVTNNYNSTHGCVLAYATLLGMTSVNGGGVIATVAFNAVGAGSTPLRLTDIKLGDEKIPPQPIPYSAFDGAVQVTGLDGNHDVAVTAVALAKTAIGHGYAGNITLVVENQGSYAETFNVSIHANLLEIATIRNVTLANGTSTNLNCEWSTLGFAKGNYTIWAYAEQVLGEVDTANNNRTGSWIFVSIPGDISDPYRLVDIFDVVKITGIYESMLGDPEYQANSDIDNNGIIDIFDVVACTGHYEETW